MFLQTLHGVCSVKDRQETIFFTDGFNTPFYQQVLMSNFTLFLAHPNQVADSEQLRRVV
jgi:hypothetical protein